MGDWKYPKCLAKENYRNSPTPNLRWILALILCFKEVWEFSFSPKYFVSFLKLNWKSCCSQSCNPSSSLVVRFQVCVTILHIYISIYIIYNLIVFLSFTHEYHMFINSCLLSSSQFIISSLITIVTRIYMYVYIFVSTHVYKTYWVHLALLICACV